MRSVGRREHRYPRSDALLGEPLMHIGRREEAEARMMVLGATAGRQA